jgi:hypothetical protein
MDDMIFYYALPTFGNLISGTAESMNDLRTRFQEWCLQFDITRDESKAMWWCGSSSDIQEFPDDYDVWGAAMNGYQKLPHPNVNVDFDNMETILGERKRYLVSWVKKIGEWREVLYSAIDIHVHPIDDAIEIRENITAFLYENAGLPEEAEILITAVYTL